MASKAKTKAMTLRRRIRERQVNSIDTIFYCIFVAVLLAFILFTMFSSIAEHIKKNQAEITVINLEDFYFTDQNAFISKNSFMNEAILGTPLAFSPCTSSKTDEEKTVTEDTIPAIEKEIAVEKETSVTSAEEDENPIVSTEEKDLDISTSEDNFIVPATEYEINLVVQAVQHEVGAWEDFYPDADLDEVQQIMARVIINQVGLPGCGDSIYEVLFLHPGHFMPIEELEGIDPFEERTRRNVLKVLKGEDSHSPKVTIEMSFSRSCTFEDSIEVMESQVGPVNPYFWTTTAEGRLLVFAESAEDD